MRLRTRLLVAMSVAACWARPGLAEVATIEKLTQLSLEELSNVEVMSASKSPQPLQSAPASMYVITRDEIARSGATTVPDALRLAPNLQVTQLSANNYVIAARGFAGNPDDQNFSNKLLMLIDGRSVYTPLFSGIYLDAQDVVLEDVDRIEVISGPGATLWGANAMNGVINIITRDANETQGLMIAASAGNEERNGTLRYGGNAAGGDFRVYAKALKRDSMETLGGNSAQDSWYRTQGGFRMDWTRTLDNFTVQGDAYRAIEEQPSPGELRVVGANVLTRWQHRGEYSDTQLQAYYDLTERGQPPGGVAFRLHTYDVELQQSLEWGSRNRIVWGAGERLSRYQISNSSSLLFDPDQRSLWLGNVFLQDTLRLKDSLHLVVGAKWEHDPYSGWAFQPDMRLSWTPNSATTVWTAASRAIRSPTPFDVDVVEKLGGVVFLTGYDTFKPEQVTAYEIGYRGRASDRFSLSFSLFYNVYDDLRTVEPASSSSFLPLHWDNMMHGHTYGVDTWLQWQVTDGWQLGPSVRWLHKSLSFDASSSRLLGVEQASNDVTSQAALKSSLNLNQSWNFDATLRYVGALPSPALPSYYELNAQLTWQPSRSWQLALSGLNLLHAHHLEYPAPNGNEIERSVMISARWSY